MLGSVGFTEELRREIGGNELEQAQLKALWQPVAWSRIVWGGGADLAAGNGCEMRLTPKNLSARETCPNQNVG